MTAADAVAQEVAAYLADVLRQADADIEGSDDITRYAFAFGRLRAAVAMAVGDLTRVAT